MAVVIVDAGAVRRALDALAPMSRPGRCGDATWELDASGLTLRWAGATLGFDPVEPMDLPPATAATVPESVMLRVRHILPKQGTLRVEVTPQAVALDGVRLTASPVEAGRESLLPVGASALDVVMLTRQHSAEEIASAGLADAVADTDEKLRTSVAAAARSLAWLGVDAAILGAWVSAHLDARARGERTFAHPGLTAEADGQLALFGGAAR
jgi:hypothetical protein